MGAVMIDLSTTFLFLVLRDLGLCAAINPGRDSSGQARRKWKEQEET
jgi:hypothetical protein